MASSDRVQGIADTFSLMDDLPKAAELEAGRDLYEIGKLALAAQQRQVAKDTGALEAGLTIQVLIGQLRVRSGLFGLGRRGSKQKLGDLFYGVIVAYGRKAQTVLRRAPGSAGARSGRRRAADVAKRYSLRVTALAPRDFIDVLDTDPLLNSQVTARLAGFWSRTLTDVGAL